MNKLKLLSFIVALGFSYLSKAEVEWKSHYYFAQDFRIDFIEQPQESLDTIQLNEQPLYCYNKWVDVKDTTHDNVQYSASETTYPAHYIHSDSTLTMVEEFIGSTQSDMSEDNDFTLLHSILIELNGYPGKEFKWKCIKSNRDLIYRYYLVKNKLYELSVVCNDNQNNNGSINRFFSSFKLLNETDGHFKIPIQSGKRKSQITFPGKTTDTYRLVDTDFGKISIDIRTYTPVGENDNLLYMLTESGYNTDVVDEKDPIALNDFYIKHMEKAISSANGVLMTLTDVNYKNYAGKEFRFHVRNETSIFVYRSFMINHCLYSIVVATNAEKDNNAAMKSFFDSFDVVL